jgi:hypothetical protein
MPIGYCSSVGSTIGAGAATTKESAALESAAKAEDDKDEAVFEAPMLRRACGFCLSDGDGDEAALDCGCAGSDAAAECARTGDDEELDGANDEETNEDDVDGDGEEEEDENGTNFDRDADSNFPAAAAASAAAAAAAVEASDCDVSLLVEDDNDEKEADGVAADFFMACDDHDDTTDEADESEGDTARELD